MTLGDLPTRVCKMCTTPWQLAALRSASKQRIYIQCLSPVYIPNHQISNTNDMSDAPRERPRLNLKPRDESAVKKAELDRAHSGKAVSHNADSMCMSFRHAANAARCIAGQQHFRWSSVRLLTELCACHATQAHEDLPCARCPLDR